MTGVKLFWFRVPDQEPPSQAALSLLDASERARSDRFKVERPRRIFVAARAALRSILGAELDLEPRSLRFLTEPHGKPHLEPSWDLGFNLAHSGSTVVIALAHGTAIGVDVEELGHDVPALRLARRFFTDTEANAVATARKGSRLRVFHHCWTAKEAVLKATGSGLTVSVSTIDVDPDPNAPPRVCAIAGDGDVALLWNLLRHERRGEWIATVAHQGAKRELKVVEYLGL